MAFSNVVCLISSSSTFNLDDLNERKTELYHEVYQIKKEMSTCDYELHFRDKDLPYQNGVNGIGSKHELNLGFIKYIPVTSVYVTEIYREND